MLNPLKLSYKNLKFWTWHRDHPYLKGMTGLIWLVHFVLCNLFEYRDIEKEEPSGDSLSYPTYDKTLYLRRFYLIRHGKDKTFLHNILRSDNDRHMHDHPWDFSTRILVNGYDEECPLGWRYLATHSKVDNKAEHAHKVHLWKDENGAEMPVWSLVRLTEARREWGFHTETGWVPWYLYLHEDPETNTYEEDVVKSVENSSKCAEEKPMH
jgi:hypothetical protein